MLTIEKIEAITLNTVEKYLKNCMRVSKMEGKHTRSIWFKDHNGEFTVFIYSLLHNSCTVLATVEEMPYNCCISKEEFNRTFNSY
jgi:hypothetical protein